MKPPPLDYVRAQSLDHALDALADAEDEAMIIAGGQSLVPMLNLRLARPELLVDINDVPATEVAVSGDTVRIGCLVRHRQLEHDPRVHDAAPLLALCAREIGHPAIRNRGTVGGSLCHADPTAELTLAALTLGARFALASTSGARTVAADEFFQGPFMTALGPGELLTEVRLPAHRASHRHGFREMAERSGDFATAAAACALTLDDGRVTDARVAVVGAGSTPIRLASTETAVVSCELGEIDPSTAAEAADAGVAGLEISDAADNAVGAGAFRAHVLRGLLADALTDAVADPPVHQMSGRREGRP